jgi:hypothetical protein
MLNTLVSGKTFHTYSLLYFFIHFSGKPMTPSGEHKCTRIHDLPPVQVNLPWD